MSAKHLLFIADGRSPTALRWISASKKIGFRVTLISTYPVTEDNEAEQTFILPVAFASVGRDKTRTGSTTKSQQTSFTGQLIKRFRPFALRLRYQLAPGTLPKYGKILQRIISEIRPDLVHALRIPYEGMLASYIPHQIPLLVSVWGNDFTLHAQAGKKMLELTRQVMLRADGLLADTERDVQLAHQFGFSREKNTLVVPGGGGINFMEIENAQKSNLFRVDNPYDQPVIVNPRGIRSYAQTDIFFQAVPIVLQTYPQAQIFCADMQGKIEAQTWVNQLHLEKSVQLLPSITQMELWSLFSQSHISVSLTTHDGTPNTLLEAMTCGCFPIAGDIESLREWITPGWNGFLVETGKPATLAAAIINAMQNPQLRTNAAERNAILIRKRADKTVVQQMTQDFYKSFL